MLRTTISRLRKVCSVAFVPRILRGDQCSAAVSFAAKRKSHKTTKSTVDGEHATTEKNNYTVPDNTFSSAAELKIDEQFKKKISEPAGLGDKTANENKQTILTAKLPLTHREKCQRLIDQAFGKADNTQPDRVLSEQYFSHTVNIEDTRREINESERAKLKLQDQKIHIDNPLLPDDRSQYSIFHTSREFNETHDDEIVIMDSTSTREPDLAKHLENVKGTAEKTSPVEEVKGTAEETSAVEEPNLSQAKEDFDKCVNNPESIEKKAFCDNDAETIEVVKDEIKPDLYRKATPTYQPHVPWFLNATTERELNLTYRKENVDKCVKNPEKVKKKVLCDDDAETIKLVKDERKHDLNHEATPKYQPHTPQFLNATTAKEDEELLTQKLETIEETPIVEAHKPKLEGFNVTPRVLGNEPTLNIKIIENNQDNSPKGNLSGALDEVSKRCLHCPLGQIDEMLINEMEKLGMTYKTAQKAPSTPMADDLVQMDVLNKQPNSTIEEQEMHSERLELEEKENESAFDTRISNVNEQAEAIRKSEEIVKPAKQAAHDLVHPDHIRIQLKPVSRKSEEYNPADDYKSTKKFACYVPTHRAAELNKQEIQETIRNSCAPINKQFEKPFPLDGPSLKGPLSATPNSRAFLNNQTDLYSIQSNETNVLFETPQNTQTASAATEAEKTSAEDINTTMNALKSLGDEIRTPTERNLDKNSFDARNLSAAYVWGHYQNGLASKYRNVDQTLLKGTDKVEHHGPTTQRGNPPIRQSTTEVQGERQERQTTANRLFAKVPYTNFSLPCEKWNTEIEHLPTVDKITKQCSNKLYSIEKSQPKPEQDCEKASLPEEILKEHKLDPYYVLTCNETCPIALGSTISACKNSDFVNTIETIYMKKNICESVRPKPRPIIKCENMLSDTQAHPYDMELEPKIMPEIKATGMPGIKATDMSGGKATGMSEIKATGMSEIKATGMPEIKVTDMTEIKATGMSEIKCTNMPDAIEKSMPKLSEQLTLSELLRRVRERNRLSYIKTMSGLNVQAVGKCGRKGPGCMPTAPRSTPNDPMPLPTFGLPQLKQRSPVCKPMTKPSDKCSFCAMRNGDIFPDIPYELNEAEAYAIRSKVNLTDEVFDRLQNLGKILGGVLRQVKSNVETLLARDYEPWTPIPSWKIAQKGEKNEWRPGMHGVPPCVDGCLVFPKARESMDPEPLCNLKPCEGFPKRRSFSMLDCFTVSLGANKVYDLGEF